MALLPRMALPERDTRAGEVAVRATTLRDAAVPRDVVVRDATLRDDTAAPPRDAAGVVVVRDETVGLPVTVRAVVDADGVAAVVRETVAAALPRAVAVARPVARALLPPRGDCAPDATALIGAIGSANTARIDSSVEQTKKAPASKNTVPIAFLKSSPKLRFFINTLLYPGKPGNLLISARRNGKFHVCLPQL